MAERPRAASFLVRVGGDGVTPLSDHALLLATTFSIAFAGGFLPIVNVEAYLVATAFLGASVPPVLLACAAALGQMSSKLLLYFGARRIAEGRLGSNESRLRAALDRLAAARGGGTFLVFTSALTGLPPFYFLSLAAGLSRFPSGAFAAAGFAGRFLRFATVVLIPRLA